jgi:hypothetical protein
MIDVGDQRSAVRNRTAEIKFLINLKIDKAIGFRAT